MAKRTVEKEICDACGADVRPDSLYCYNCGGAVSAEVPSKTKGKSKKQTANERPAPAGEADFDSKTADIDLKTTKLDEEKVRLVEVKPIEKPSSAELLDEIEEKPPEKPSIQEEAKLKSAASLRRKGKSFERRTVEVVWEEPENAPNKWFPIVAIVLILFVLGIFYLAMYLK